MTLTDLGNIGSFLGGIFVPISLFYLAWQVNHSKKAFELSRMSTMVVNVSNCTARYDLIMSDLSKIQSDIEAEAWWYRYWNLFSEEYFFAQKGFIDRDIFELWMMELANVYFLAPAGSTAVEMENRASAHQRYLSSILPENDEVTTFFEDLQDCAKIKDVKNRLSGVQELVNDRMPPPPPLWANSNV